MCIRDRDSELEYVPVYAGMPLLISNFTHPFLVGQLLGSGTNVVKTIDVRYYVVQKVGEDYVEPWKDSHKRVAHETRRLELLNTIASAGNGVAVPPTPEGNRSVCPKCGTDLMAGVMPNVGLMEACPKCGFSRPMGEDDDEGDDE